MSLVCQVPLSIRYSALGIALTLIELFVSVCCVGCGQVLRAGIARVSGSLLVVVDPLPSLTMLTVVPIQSGSISKGGYIWVSLTV